MAKKSVRRQKTLSEQGCDCVAQVQDYLGEHNCQLVIECLMNLDTGTIRSSPPSLRVEKVEPKRTRLKTVFCAYCPFCGKKYQ